MNVLRYSLQQVSSLSTLTPTLHTVCPTATEHQIWINPQLEIVPYENTSYPFLSNLCFKKQNKKTTVCFCFELFLPFLKIFTSSL